MIERGRLGFAILAQVVRSFFSSSNWIANWAKRMEKEVTKKFNKNYKSSFKRKRFLLVSVVGLVKSKTEISKFLSRRERSCPIGTASVRSTYIHTNTRNEGLGGEK